MKEWRDLWPGGLDEEDYSTLNLIAHCREGALGYNCAICEDCHQEQWYASSCGNRHCPKCLGPRQAQWSQRMCERLPNCPHFHVVFTVAEEFHEFYRKNYRLATDLLFAAAAETVQTFQKNNWGVKGSFFGVLHTWGSALNWHPHLHLLVSSGGQDLESGRWKQARPDYLFPVKAMSRVFRAIVLRRLEELDTHAEAHWPDGLGSVEQRRDWRLQLARKNWNIFSRATLGNTRAVVRYLARYTSRIAMSNQRITGVDEERQTVSFTWKDYRNGGGVKEVELSAARFVRRFVQHLVPKGLRRVRAYGLLAGKKEALRTISGVPEGPIAESPPEVTARICPECEGQNWKFAISHARRCLSLSAGAQRSMHISAGALALTGTASEEKRFSLWQSLGRFLAARDGPKNPPATTRAPSEGQRRPSFNKRMMINQEPGRVLPKLPVPPFWHTTC